MCLLANHKRPVERFWVLPIAGDVCKRGRSREGQAVGSKVPLHHQLPFLPCTGDVPTADQHQRLLPLLKQPRRGAPCTGQRAIGACPGERRRVPGGRGRVRGGPEERAAPIAGCRLSARLWQAGALAAHSRHRGAAQQAGGGVPAGAGGRDREVRVLAIEDRLPLQGSSF